MQFYMNYTRWDMQIHQNRKAEWAVRHWGPDGPPVKFGTGSKKGLVVCDCPKMYCGPSTVQRQFGLQKRTVSVLDLEMNCGPSAGERRTVRRSKAKRNLEMTRFCLCAEKCTADRPGVNGGPSAVQQTGKQLSARFLVVSMCKWRTVRRVRADRPATALVGVCS